MAGQGAAIHFRVPPRRLLQWLVASIPLLARPSQALIAMSEPPCGPRLIIVCGLPGSGKTTHAREVEQALRAIRFCPDEWMDAMRISLWDSEARERIEQLQWKLARDILVLGHNVVIEWGTWAKSERDALRTGARGIGAAVELHFLDAPVEVLLERVRRRNTESPAITIDDFMKWAEIFERPSSEEMALFDGPPEQEE